MLRFGRHSDLSPTWDAFGRGHISKAAAWHAVDLIRAIEDLRAGAGAEHTRRRELEGALRESAAIFKRELHDKNLELAALQQQLGYSP